MRRAVCASVIGTVFFGVLTAAVLSQEKKLERLRVGGGSASCRRAMRFSMSPMRWRTSMVETFSDTSTSCNHYSCSRCYGKP